MTYRIYFYWENRRSTTHKDVKTRDSAIAIAKAKAENHRTLMSVEILAYDTEHNYNREVISREELLSVK